jgi:hypothetical protein
MSAVAWLVLVCSLCTTASYLLWCADRLPRARLLLALVAVPCFVAALTLHGNFLPAPSAAAP